MPTIALQGAALGMLISAVALTLLLLRWLRSRSVIDTGPGLPWQIRWGWKPSRALLPLMRYLPALILRRSAQAMAAERWAASVSGERWLAIRCTQSLMASCIAGVAAGILGFSITTAMPVAAIATFLASADWIRRRRMLRDQAIARELPAYLDLLTVSIEAGSSLTAAMRLIAGAAPPSALRDYLERVLRQVRAGRMRADAFSSVAEQFDSAPLRTLATALAHGEASGMSLGAILRAQAAQRTAERFARAEKLAMEAPVKLLGPLILCIFPCTFIVLAIPIIVKMKEALSL
ncbi:MAG: type II secretion system F family protein [Nevskiaceae bacterium]|nr:type II secretion system F family protein [Nevskiaceae bacterium]